MRPFLFLLLCTCAQLGFGQKVTKFYTSAKQDSGTLYFINTREEVKNKKANSRFSYQISYITSADSVVVNFSVTDDDALQIDSLRFRSSSAISAAAEKLFIDPAKKLWHNRYTARFSFEEFKSLLEGAAPLSYAVHAKSGTIAFVPPAKKGRKTAAILKRIFAIIDLNRS